ncbi:MAG TPA: DUF2505 domain-containing protein [Jatrophihabitantaceae bacterium]
MKIERSMYNDIPVVDLFEMMCTKAYQERKCVDAGALSHDVCVARTDDGAVIKTKRKMPTVGFPSLLRKFVPSGVTSTETVTWGPAAADGSRSADLHVDFHGTPARMKGTIRIVPQGADASSVLVDAEFKANVPLVGGRVEGIAAPIILGVIDAEEATGRAWARGVR